MNDHLQTHFTQQQQQQQIIQQQQQKQKQTIHNSISSSSKSLTQSRSDSDPSKYSFHLLSQHQTNNYDYSNSLAPSKRSLLQSESNSQHSLHHLSSPPSTSSNHPHSLNPLMSNHLLHQNPKHSHLSDTTSTQHPRLFQPQPRRIPPNSPDLQLPSSPQQHHPQAYPSNIPSVRQSQSTTSRPPQQHSQINSSIPIQKVPLESPRLHDQHHLSIQVFPHNRYPHPIPSAHHSTPPEHIQSLYVHESPRIQQSSDFSNSDTPTQSCQHQLILNDSSQKSLNHTSEPSYQIRSQDDRSLYYPQNFIPHNTPNYHPRDHLYSTSTTNQFHSSYSNSSQRQKLQTHYEQHEDSIHQQVRTHPAESPSCGKPHSTVNRVEPSPMSYSTTSPLKDSQSLPRVGLQEKPIKDLHEQNITRICNHNHPGQQFRPITYDQTDESSRVKKSSPWLHQLSTPLQTVARHSKSPDTSNSFQLDITRDELSKTSTTSQTEQLRSKTFHEPSPNRLNRFSPDLSHLNSPPFRPTPPSNYDHTHEVDKTLPSDHPSPSVSGVLTAQKSATNHPHREMSAGSSSTEEEVLDDGMDDGVIRCICSVTTDDGFTIQCEICEVWQHAVCVNVPIDEVPEHYFCDQCDPLPERRRQLIEMAPQAERIQRHRLKKEAQLRSHETSAGRSPPTIHGSPNLSNSIVQEGQIGTIADSPTASTSISRVSSSVCVSESVGFEVSGQSPNGQFLKGKGKLNSSTLLDKLQTNSYTDNGLGLSGLQESPIASVSTRVEDSPSIKDPIPRKPGRKPMKFSQTKSSFSKGSLDSPIACMSASHVLDTDNIFPQTIADADDRYEAWRYEYTPTLKDLYLDVDVKSQVQKLIKQYFQNLWDDENPSDSDTDITGPVGDHTGKPSSKPLSKHTDFGSSSVPSLTSPPSNNIDSTIKPQRATPHSFGNTQFLPVTMVELPPPLKLTIKAVPASAINFFPSLTTNPFCPTFSNSLNNSSTSSLPRLITHGVFSAQPISRGSYIASLKGSITSFRKYTQDVFSQYDTLGCNKPFVKFFKSTRLPNHLLRGHELGQINDGLVIDSRQYGNEMRFIRNGCHPNAFINVIVTPSAHGLRHPDFLKSSDWPHTQSTTDRPVPLSNETPEARDDFTKSRGDPLSVTGSLMDRDLHLPLEVSFGIFAANDISRREEIILPWDWDDQHLAHLLPRLLSHSSIFEFQKSQRSPPLPPVRSQFLPWSISDLKLLSRKLAAVTLTLFGLMFCGCERKKSCAINLMWKVGCLSAGEPLFPNKNHLSSDYHQTSEILPISSLKERQEMVLPLTFEENFRLVLHSFLEQPNHLTSKIGKNLNSNIHAPCSGRPKRHKVDLGPLLGLRRDWWNFPPSEQVRHPQVVKLISRKQKRPRSRSVSNRNPSVNKIRRVSDIGETRRHGLFVAKDDPDRDNTLVNHDIETSTTENGFTQSINHTETPEKDVTLKSDYPNQPRENINFPSDRPMRESSECNDPENHANFTESLGAISADNVQNHSTHLTEPSFKMSEAHHGNQVTNSCDLVSEQVHESDGVIKRVTPSVQDANVSIPTCPSPLPVLTVGDLSSEHDHIENVQLRHAEEQLLTDIIPEKVTSQYKSEKVEPPVTVPHESPHSSETVLQTVGKLDNASSGLFEEGELAVEAKVTAGPIIIPAVVHEQHLSNSHGYQTPNESSNDLEIGMVNQSSSRFSPKADIVEPCVEGRSPERTLESSASKSVSLDQISSSFPLQNCSQALTQHSSEANALEASPTSNVNSKPTLDPQIDVNIQDSDLSIVQATCSQQDDPLPILSAEPSGPSPQPVSISLDTISSSSQSRLKNVHEGRLITDKPTGGNENQIEQNLAERKPLNSVSSVERNQSPLVPVAPLESEGSPTVKLESYPSRTPLRSGSLSNESEFEALAGESVLSHASDQSEEILLDSDASTTILGSSDEEMLSSHTPRYLNNRKRIRSKNIIKPIVRLNQNHKTDSSRVEPSNESTPKSEGRSNDKSAAPHRKEAKNSNKLSGSTSSDIDSEEDQCAISSKSALRESGSKVRLTIRSSSPLDNDAITTKSQHRLRISSTPSSLSTSDPTQNCSEDADALATEELSPRLVLASIPPADPNSQSTSPKAAITRPEEEDPLTRSTDGGSCDSNMTTFSKTNHMHHDAIALQLPDESRSEILPVAVAQDVIDVEPKLDDLDPTTCNSTSSVTDNLAPKYPSNTPPDQFNLGEISLDEKSQPRNNAIKNVNIDQSSAASQSVKRPPKRISLKDYRSRKVGEPLNVTPMTNPLIHFSTIRPPQTTVTETTQKKQPPTPIIPALPPLLPPSQQSQPLLPLSPRKLELVASVLKKEGQDRMSTRDDETGSSTHLIEVKIPPGLSSPSIINSHVPSSNLAEFNKPNSDLPAGDQSGSVCESKMSKEMDRPDKSCEEDCNPSVSGLEDGKVPNDDAGEELLEDDIDGVAIESMSNSWEDEFEDEGNQQNGLEFSNRDPTPEEKGATLMSLPSDHVIPASIPDFNVDPPALEEQTEQMKVDSTSNCLDMPAVKLDDDTSSLPLVGNVSFDDSYESVQNKESDTDDSPDGTAQSRAPFRPRLSLAAYRQRLAAARSSTSNELHQSQPSSPFLHDLDLMKATSESSTPGPSSHQGIVTGSKQEQDVGASQSDTLLQLAVTAQESNPPESPLIRSLDVELKPKINITTSTDLATNHEVATELRPSDATMYFPPISPSILMDKDGSPRSPDLESSSSPVPSSKERHETVQLPSSSSSLVKSPRRTPLQSTSVPSNSNLEGDIEVGRVGSSAISLVITESSLEPFDNNPKSLGPTTRPLSKQPVNRPSTNSLDHLPSSPSFKTGSLPVSMPSHPTTNQVRTLIPSSSVGPSSSHPTPNSSLPPRIQTSEPSSLSTPMDEPSSLSPAPPSRLTMGSSIRPSSTISLSPQRHNPNISPSSPVPPGFSDLRSSPRGSSNLTLASSRSGHHRVSHRPPQHFNSSSSSRSSWPPESTTTSMNDNFKSTSEVPASPPMMIPTTTGIHRNTSKNIPESSSSTISLPMTPNHTVGASSRTHHPNYHPLSNRTTPFLPPSRNFPDHRTASMPIMETSGPGPPSSQFRQNGSSERVRYEGVHRTQINTRSPPPFSPNRGRAKVRGTGQSYWSIDNPANARNFGNGSRNDR